MPRRDYLIDGYNLLHAAGFARARYGPGEMHRARRRLLALIAEHLDEDSRERIEIVFDAHDPPPDRSSETRAWNMRVRYSVETGDADAMIEERIREHSAPRQLWVVSSDHRLIDAAKRRRAKSLTSEVFLDRLFEDRIVRRSREPPAGEPEETSGTTAEWLAFFGFDAASTVDVNVEPSEHASIASRESEVGVRGSGKSRKTKDRENYESEDFSQPSTLNPQPSTDRAGEIPNERQTGSLASEAAFWQRRIDELFKDPPQEGAS